MEKSKKLLIVFDMDDTIINGNTYLHVCKNLLKPETLDSIVKDVINNKNLLQVVNTAIFHLKQEANATLSDFHKVLKEIPLNEGFEDLFKLIRNNKNHIEAMLLTGSNQVFAKAILENHNLQEVFDYVHANPVQLDEESKSIENVKECHLHDCKHCIYGQCKKKTLKDHLDEHHKENEDLVVFYVGDAVNDLCPGFVLKGGDVLFARQGFSLDKFIDKRTDVRQALKCEVCPWSDGNIIRKKLEDLLDRISVTESSSE